MKVSEIGMGCEGFAENDCQNTKLLFDTAEECGINYFDLYASDPKVRASVGNALSGRREKFMIQSHICSVWKDGQYKRTRKRKKRTMLWHFLLSEYKLAGALHVLQPYGLLSHYAGECIECGACETRCPFGVSIRENMKLAKDIFGK